MTRPSLRQSQAASSRFRVAGPSGYAGAVLAALSIAALSSTADLAFGALDHMFPPESDNRKSHLRVEEKIPAMPATQHRRTFNSISYGSGIRRRNVGIGVVMASAILGRFADPNIADPSEWLPSHRQKHLGQLFLRPLDANTMFVDGRPLFGASKTVRGILISVVTTSACAPLLGLKLEIGLVVATTAMAGDLLSSFMKRRLTVEQQGCGP